MKPVALCSVCLTVLLAFAVSPTRADIAPSHVSIDLSGLTGPTDVELVFEFFDNSGTIGDSWVHIDNVTLGGIVDANFEGGTFAGFDDTFNTPGTVVNVPGSLDGTGSKVMEINEDPVFFNTFVFKDFWGTSATSLAFDFQFLSPTPTAGFFGYDEFVVSLLDANTFDPLLTGLTPGLGDILSVDASGSMASAAGVSVTAIPAPGAAVLTAIGLGCMGAVRRRLQRA